MTGNQKSLNLAGAANNCQSATVAVQSLNGILFHIAVAAMQLQHVVRCAHRYLGTKQLGHAGSVAKRFTFFCQPGSVIDQVAKRFDLSGGVGDKVLDRLLVGNGAAKLFVFDGKADTGRQRMFRPTQTNRAQP